MWRHHFPGSAPCLPSLRWVPLALQPALLKSQCGILPLINNGIKANSPVLSSWSSRVQFCLRCLEALGHLRLCTSYTLFFIYKLCDICISLPASLPVWLQISHLLLAASCGFAISSSSPIAPQPAGTPSNLCSTNVKARVT